VKPVFAMSNAYNNSDNIYEFCKLIDVMINDIKHLESETVRYRYALSCYLPDHEKENLRSDILSNLADRYYWSEAYQQYIQMFYNNQDPMDSDEWCEHICRLAHGHDDSEY
jgi:hypothetical protein